MAYPCGVYRGFVEFMGHPVYNPISRLFWVTEIMKLGKIIPFATYVQQSA